MTALFKTMVFFYYTDQIQGISEMSLFLLTIFFNIFCELEAKYIVQIVLFILLFLFS